MKNSFLSVFILLIGISTIAMAQVPCSTLEKCQELRKPLEEQPKKGNAQIETVTPHQQSVTWTPITTEVEVAGIRSGVTVYWSDVLQDTYDNLDLYGTKPINNIIQESHATEACKAIGGRLPTKADFDKFIGNDDFLKLPGTENNWFWSSSVVSFRPAIAYGFFNGFLGVDNTFRFSHRAVRCVRS